MAVLLVLWAVIGLGCGVLWSDWLNQFRLPGTGYPLGFWFAAQGSLIVFVVLLFWFARQQNAIDEKYGFAEED